MKATGIVRRIDDLGRVVIPKEIRRVLRIREGDPLEIFTDKDGEVIFKKYSPIGELGDFASQYAETLFKTAGMPICITDKDSIIAVSGASRRELYERKVSPEIEKIMEEKTSFISTPTTKKDMVIVEGSVYSAGVVEPIISDGDTIGSVVMMKESPDKNMGEAEEKLAKAAAMFLGKQMEI